MNYRSTRGGTPPTTLGAAIAAGLAPDGGLYVPEALPRLAPQDFDGRETLAEIGVRLLAPFCADDPLADALPAICAEAFDFPTPLRALATPGDFMLELFHGPTAAFKDFGARFLAACLTRQPRADARPLTILVATSGDTGAAVAAAFADRPGTRVLVLYPHGRVSPRQAHQLGCFGGNVQALRVDGSFDDCQHLVKQALGDQSLRARAPLGSANSISLGRLLPQMVYYAKAALDYWRAQGAPLGFVVPTGNLGNAFACILARALGLPIGRIALATNANRGLPDFFSGAAYAARPSVTTLANAMDVGAPSNFERLRWLYPNPESLREAFRVESVDDQTIRATIQRHAEHGGVFCPHTATAVHLLERLRAAGSKDALCAVATAHPAKFEQVVEPLIGATVPLPAALATLVERPSSAFPLANDYAALRQFVESAAPEPV